MGEWNGEERGGEWNGEEKRESEMERREGASGVREERRGEWNGAERGIVDWRGERERVEWVRRG